MIYDLIKLSCSYCGNRVYMRDDIALNPNAIVSCPYCGNGLIKTLGGTKDDERQR